MKTWTKYTTALLCALAAANGILQLVPVPVVTEILGLLGALGLYVAPSPLQAP